MIRSFEGKTPRIHPTAFVSETAYIIGDVEIGERATIWPGVVVRGDIGRIVIGDETHIEDNSVIHGSPNGVMTIGSNCTIGHLVVMHGDRLGDGSLLGNGAIVLDGATIGEWCMIGAGSVVTPRMDVPDRSFVIGNPARVQGEIQPHHEDRRRFGGPFNVDLGQRYVAQGLGERLE